MLNVLFTYFIYWMAGYSHILSKFGQLSPLLLLCIALYTEQSIVKQE